MGWIDERLPNGLRAPLTPRQDEVVKLVALGLEYDAIGEQLHMSEPRVKQHVKAIAQLLPNPRRLKPHKLVLMWAVAQEFNGQGRQ